MTGSVKVPEARIPGNNQQDLTPAAMLLRAQRLLHAGQRERALVAADHALRLDPGLGAAHLVRGQALVRIGFYAEAIRALDRALERDPALVQAPAMALDAANYGCDWTERDRRIDAVLNDVRAHPGHVHPFGILALADDPELQRAVARAFAEEVPAAPAWPAPPATGRRLRLGFVASAFRDHPMSQLLLSLLRRLDRARFEVLAFASPDMADAVTGQVAAAVDRMIHVRHLPDAALVAEARDAGIDIALDCDGYTQGGRYRAFRKRLAPVQVGFLGFPGTSGGVHDYFIADPVTVPDTLLPCFDEAVVRLPDTYACNSHGDDPVPMPAQRAAHGLPETGFVFCCFNASWKFTPEVFAIWLRLLHAAPGSVLWLRSAPRDTGQNLRAAVADAGIDPSRLVFAPHLDLDAHLSRLALADLFLDTLPCNAHSTALDALRAGVPVLTCTGRSFAARVATSHLHALGLPELAVDSLAVYETTARRLASGPAELGDLRRRLDIARRTSPLFDTPRYAACLETALAAMHARSAAGNAPLGFDVGNSGDVRWRDDI
ncbi:MAG: hypothetical protein VYB54_11900 [Pseudomonadota bacterium]|nr:hypothetical protein [Pseudomonadota bacterium]